MPIPKQKLDFWVNSYSLLLRKIHFIFCLSNYRFEQPACCDWNTWETKNNAPWFETRVTFYWKCLLRLTIHQQSVVLVIFLHLRFYGMQDTSNNNNNVCRASLQIQKRMLAPIFYIFFFCIFFFRFRNPKYYTFLMLLTLLPIDKVFF